MRYFVFIDESGEANVSKVDLKFDVFVLCGVFFREDHYKEFDSALKQIKRKYFGSEDVVLHSYEMRWWKGAFKIFDNKKIRTSFYADMEKVFTESNYKIISCIVNKKEYKQRYPLKNYAYEESFKFLCERTLSLVGKGKRNKSLSFLKTHWSFSDNKIILDFSTFKDFMHHERFIEETLNNLLLSNVNVVLSVQTNSSEAYKNMARRFVTKYNCGICFRFSNQSGGILNFDKDIDSLSSTYGNDQSKTIILIDLGQIDSSNYNILGSTTGILLKNSNHELHQFNAVVIASSSFPSVLSDYAVQNEPHLLTRYEWSLFHTVKSSGIKFLKYGDYGTKTADYRDLPFPGSISLKYTTPKNFLIYRGYRSQDHRLGHKQFIEHAKKLINSPDYSGSDFCWGDLLYKEKSQESLGIDGKPGSSTNWVEYSQNHHITLMHSIL